MGKAGIHLSGDVAVEEWVPAFPTEQVRGLKAHGNAEFLEWDIIGQQSSLPTGFAAALRLITDWM